MGAPGHIVLPLTLDPIARPSGMEHIGPLPHTFPAFLMERHGQPGIVPALLAPNDAGGPHPHRELQGPPFRLQLDRLSASRVLPVQHEPRVPVLPLE